MLRLLWKTTLGTNNRIFSTEIIYLMISTLTLTYKFINYVSRAPVALNQTHEWYPRVAFLHKVPSLIHSSTIWRSLLENIVQRNMQENHNILHAFSFTKHFCLNQCDCDFICWTMLQFKSTTMSWVISLYVVINKQKTVFFSLYLTKTCPK